MTTASHFQNRPRIIVDSRIDLAMSHQLIPRLQHLTDLHPQLRRNILQVQALIVLRTRPQRLIDPPRRHRERTQRHPRPRPVPVSRTILLLQLMLAPRSGERALGAIGKLLGRAAGEVQVDVRRLEQVVLDLIVVRQRADDVGVDVAFVVEGPQAAPDADVGVFDEARPVDATGGGGVGVGGGAVVRVGPRPRPQLHFEGAGAVVELVVGVGGLDRDVADLADEGELRMSKISG